MGRNGGISMTTKHGVLLDNGCVILMSGDYGLQYYNRPPVSLEDMMSMGIDLRLTHLWVLPSIGMAFRGTQAQAMIDNTEKWDVGQDGKFVSVVQKGKWKGYIKSITGRTLQPYSQNMRLIFVQQSNWPFDDATPTELLEVISKIETTLVTDMNGSPTTVGLRHLERMNAKYRVHYFEKSSAVDWDELSNNFAPAIAWFPICDVPVPAYLHCFDRNASHPFAAAQEDMGVGTPYHQEGGVFSAKLPGLWDVEITDSNMLPYGLPPLFPRGRQWLPTPMLRVATMPQIGYSVKVNQAFLWPEGKPIFERWARSLWKLRGEYLSETMENEAVKAIMNSTVGGTRHGEEMEDTFRPDWYATIIGSERAVVWYKAWKIATEQNIFPVGCYADALYYLSFKPSPVDAVPGLINKKDSMGGYKHVWTLPIGEIAREVLMSRMSAALRIGALKKLVKGGTL
jgi:hypothetical protein